MDEALGLELLQGLLPVVHACHIVVQIGAMYCRYAVTDNWRSDIIVDIHSNISKTE